jgi:multimeric flavodoxin WrbA
LKKVLAIIGSPNGEKSNTRAMTVDFLDMVRQHYRDVEYEIIMLGEKNLEYCRGCWSCTRTGSCVIQDDLQEIQNKMKGGDLLIMGSPVYVLQVSGQMKVLFDRTYIWLHTLRLIGKPAITAVTTAYTGLRAAERYLRNMTSCMGAIVFGSLRGRATLPGKFPQRERSKRRHQGLAQKAADILQGKIKVRPKLRNSWYYWGMKCKAKYGKEDLPYEYKYWNEKGWLDLSLRQALKKERR